MPDPFQQVEVRPRYQARAALDLVGRNRIQGTVDEDRRHLEAGKAVFQRLGVEVRLYRGPGLEVARVVALHWGHRRRGARVRKVIRPQEFQALDQVPGLLLPSLLTRVELLDSSTRRLRHRAHQVLAEHLRPAVSNGPERVDHDQRSGPLWMGHREVHGEVATPRVARDPGLRPPKAVENAHQVRHVALDAAVAFGDRRLESTLLIAKDGECWRELHSEAAQVFRQPRATVQQHEGRSIAAQPADDSAAVDLETDLMLAGFGAGWNRLLSGHARSIRHATYDQQSMPDTHVKVAITGAAGQIGYSLLFRIASGQMFGPETTIDLQLLELDAALPALEGVAMELEDCAFPLLRRILRTSSADEAFSGANWALLVGAVPRREGMERKDLLRVNGGIFTAQGKAIAANAADDVRVLVVGNPCNTNCLIAAANAPKIPRDRWFAMTMLDENRGRSQLAARARVAVADVRDLAVWGNHSSTQFPDAYHATISGRPAPEVIGDEDWLQEDFVRIVQQRGAEIIKARGQSSAASAANAVIDTVRQIAQPSGELFSAAVPAPLRDGYDVPEGIVFGYPLRATAPGDVQIVQGIEHAPWAQAKIDRTRDELLEEREAVMDLMP